MIYAYDSDAGVKHQRAKDLIAKIWETRVFPALSIQVLQESHVNFVRKGLPGEESARIVSRYLTFRIVENSRMLFIYALEIQQKHKLSFWDASIVAAAQRSQAREYGRKTSTKVRNSMASPFAIRLSSAHVLPRICAELLRF